MRLPKHPIACPALALLCLSSAAPWSASAQTEVAPSCVEIEVNGERIRDYECFSGLLKPKAVSPAATVPQLSSEQRIRQPPSALGLANRAATQQRMGSTFGVSTQPQRPPPIPPPPRPGN